MTIKIRALSTQEQQTLAHWQRGDDAVRYRHAHVLLLASKTWTCDRIAEALGLYVETVRPLIEAFNQYGLAAVMLKLRSDGRLPTHGSDVGEAAEDLLRHKPPPDEVRATRTLHRLAQALGDHLPHRSGISHQTLRRLLQRRRIIYWRAKAWPRSPSLACTRHKHQRDCLLRLACMRRAWATVRRAQSWFSRWPYRFGAWASRQESLRVPQRWRERVESTALYAVLDDETQAAFLGWSEGQPNTANTVGSMEGLTDQYRAQG